MSDAEAGALVGLSGLPITLGICLSAGIPAAPGLVSAALGGAVVSLAGGSRFQISGPSAAFVLLTVEWAGRYGTGGLAVAVLMTGLFLILLGLTKLAEAVKLLPLPVVVGLLNGITLVLAVRQLEFLLGLPPLLLPESFPVLTQRLWDCFALANPWAIALSVICLGSLCFWRQTRWGAHRSFVVVLVVTAAAAWLNLPVQTLGSLDSHGASVRWFGGGFGLRPGLWLDLLIPALASAVFVSLESLLSASSADGLRSDRHNPKLEVVGQGAANIFSSLFGGMIVSGAPVRTSLNAKCGAATPIAGFVRAVVLLGIAAFAPRLVALIPLPLCGAVLLDLALTAGAWGEVPGILRRNTTDRLTWVIVLASTIAAGLVVAVEAALLLGFVYYARRQRSQGSLNRLAGTRQNSLESPSLPLACIVTNLSDLGCLARAPKPDAFRPDSSVPIVLFNGSSLTDSDLGALQRALDGLGRSGSELVIYELPRANWSYRLREKLTHSLPPRNIVPTLPAAIFRAHQLHDRFFGLAERFPG